MSMDLLMSLTRTALLRPAKQNVQNQTFRFASWIRFRRLCSQHDTARIPCKSPIDLHTTTTILASGEPCLIKSITPMSTAKAATRASSLRVGPLGRVIVRMHHFSTIDK